MESLFHNTKQFLLTDFILSGLLCSISMLLIVMILRKRKNLSIITRYLLMPLIIFIMNKLLNDTIYYNHLLKMYDVGINIDNYDLNCYSQLHKGYFNYVISFLALVYIFIFIEREETRKIKSRNHVCQMP
jgi:phosphoglycerol transferase MdoB-like AlkP superfamily enzyme